MLHDLLRIKRIREKSAQDEVTKARYRLEQAIIEVDNKTEELSTYKEWRSQEEKTLYDNIINAHVHQHDLDFLKMRIAKMREHDLVLEEAIRTAESRVKEVETELEEAQKNFQLAMQAVMKFEEFTKVLDEEEAKRKNFLEEQELEEFIPRNRD
ncbi:MAG: YscO family type III secretion system apparatus protein [Endozoicomonadaceae bacterium]|nr:YscO family type III secretion system apparatus protein [Endozoicomonadaceae bacterium]